MDWQAFALSLRLATVTTAILLAIAVPLAALLVLGRSRWLAALEALATLPMVLPPTVLGFFLLVLLGPRTAVGRGITALLGHPLAFSFNGLVVGSVIYSLPFAVQPLVAGFASVDTALVDAARLLGAGPVRLVTSILVPLARRSLLAAIVLSFLHTIGEFGVVLMLGGDIPGATRTLSIVLYNQVENFDYAAANRTAAILLGMSVLALALIYSKTQRRASARGATHVLEFSLNARRGSFHLEVECTFASDWTVVFGPSGSGKSTLLRLLAGLDRPDAAAASPSTLIRSRTPPSACIYRPAIVILRWSRSSPRSSLTSPSPPTWPTVCAVSTARPAQRVSKRCWPSPAQPISLRAARRTFPAARPNALLWPALSRPRPAFCCSTSLSPRSTE